MSRKAGKTALTMGKRRSRSSSLENLVSVNLLLVVVVILEVLVALYLIWSQNIQLKQAYRSRPSLERERNFAGQSSPQGSESAKKMSSQKQEKIARLSLVAVSPSYATNHQGDVDVVLQLDRAETISTVEGRLVYDPQAIRVDGITTRSLFKKVPSKDDPSSGVFSFLLYNENGQTISQEANLATISITPLQPGKTTLSLKLGGVATSKVIRLDNPTNILEKVRNLDILVL